MLHPLSDLHFYNIRPPLDGSRWRWLITIIVALVIVLVVVYRALRKPPE